MRTRFRFCKYCEGIHATNAWPHNCMPEQFDLRSELPAPYIVTDNLPGGIHGMRSMADGKFYDSKAAYYASLKRSGHEIVGNDPAYREPKQARPDTSDDVAEDFIKARDMLTSDSLSNDEMANMMREICPAEEVVPHG